MFRLVESFDDFLTRNLTDFELLSDIKPNIITPPSDFLKGRLQENRLFKYDYFIGDIRIDKNTKLDEKTDSIIKWFEEYTVDRMDSNIKTSRKVTSNRIYINEDYTVSLNTLTLVRDKYIKNFVNVKECKNFYFSYADINRLPKLPDDLEILEINGTKIKMLNDNISIPESLCAIYIDGDVIVNRYIKENFEEFNTLTKHKMYKKGRTKITLKDILGFR